MSRAGRKRAALAKREANGQAQRSRPVEKDKIMSVALAQPHRKGEKSHLAGFVLGRLWLTEEITPEQYHAGERYGNLARRHMRDVLGSKYRWPSSSIANRVGGGAPDGPEPNPNNIVDIERDWSDAMSALADNGLLQSGTAALARICVMDIEPSDSDDLGNARLALNVLHRIWAVEPKRKLTARKNYATTA